MLETTWRDEAACAKPWVDPEWFFPVDGEEITSGPRAGEVSQRYDPENLQRARLVCADCPVVRECWQANHGEAMGVYAGTTEHGRGKIRDRRLATPRFAPLPLSVPTARAVYAFLKGQSMDIAARQHGLTASALAATVRRQIRQAA